MADFTIIGKEISNYKILSLIGEGGMGSVYLGQHNSLQKKAAIKMLLPQFMHNIDAKQRFKQDAKILEELKHPNIVELYDYLEDETGLYLILEFIDGMQLDDYIIKEKGIIPHNEAIVIMSQILEGLEFAHSKDIIHRDIKPSNILIDKNSKIKIIDFGIAKMLDSDENLAKTMTNQGLGTPYYMSPEQIIGQKVDKRTDIYSAGIVFYEMLTGHCPYSHLSSFFELAKSIVEIKLPPPSSVYEFIPRKIDNLVMKAIEKNIDKRIHSCFEFNALINDRTLNDPIEDCIIKIKINNSEKSNIVFGNQGAIGSNSNFNFVPSMPYNLSIMSEGKKAIYKDLILKFDDKNSELEFTLEDIQIKKPNQLNILIGVILGLLILIVVVFFMFKKNSNLEDENLDLIKENNYYKSI